MPAPFSEMDISTRARHCNVGFFTSFSANNANPIHVSCSGYYGSQPYYPISTIKPLEVDMETESDNIVARKRPADSMENDAIDNKRCCLSKW